MKAIVNFIVAVFCVWSATVFAADSKAPPVPPVFGKLGFSVVSVEKGPSGLWMWGVEKTVDGAPVRTLLMTTPDGETLLSGVVWNAVSGDNISDHYMSKFGVSARRPSSPPPALDSSAPSTVQKGKLHPSIADVAALGGTTEGRGGPESTLYVIYDPQCPYCHDLYKRTREYVSKGRTIRWIPVSVVAGRRDGKRLAADILQSGKASVDVLKTVMTSASYVPKAVPSKETLSILDRNANYLFGAFDRNPGAGQVVVPVVFFVTKSGDPHMVPGVGEDEVLARIFGDIKQ